MPKVSFGDVNERIFFIAGKKKTFGVKYQQQEASTAIFLFCPRKVTPFVNYFPEKERGNLAQGGHKMEEEP